MVNDKELDAEASKLWKSPTDKTWGTFRKALLKSNAKYYRTIYANGKVHDLEDLPKSYCELFDSKYKLITKVPVYKNAEGTIEGALWYIRGMLNANMPVVKK